MSIFTNSGEGRKRESIEIEAQGYALACIINGQTGEAKRYLNELRDAWGANPPQWRDYALALQQELRLIRDAGLLDKIQSESVSWKHILAKRTSVLIQLFY